MRPYHGAMSEKDIGKELDRLLNLTPAEEPRNPLDSVCRLSIEISKGVDFSPLTSDEELELAQRNGPEAQAAKAKYSNDLFRASRCMERNYQIADAEKALEKLVIFDNNSKCFEGIAEEHLFHLAVTEERQGKLDEAEEHYRKGTQETQQEKQERLMEFAMPLRKSIKQLEWIEEVLDDVPKDQRKAENFAALARIAKRRGFDQLSTELLHRAYSKDSTNGKFLQQAADPKNFELLYFD